MGIEAVPYCCGVGDLRLNGDDPVSLCEEVADDKRKDRFNIVLFTDKVPSRSADDLVRYIKKHKLGTVVSTKARQNPVHPNHKVKAWLWNINRKNFDKKFKVPESAKTYDWW